MPGYYVEFREGKHYVVHTDTGHSIPYRAGGKASSVFDQMKIPDGIWLDFLPWLQMTNAERRTIMKETCMQDLPMTEMVTYRFDIQSEFDLAHTPTTIRAVPFPPVAKACKPKKEEKENNMGYEHNMEAEQRTHLRRRLDLVLHEKGNAIRETYHMNGIRGVTKAEILALLAAGNIEFHDDHFNKDGKLKSYYTVIETFNIVDPKKDEDGYAAAGKVLNAAYTAAKDAILVLPLADGLKALQEVEARTF